jgi:hypothetical protein
MYKAEALQKFVDLGKPSSRAEEFLFEGSEIILPAHGKSVFEGLIDPKTKLIDVKPNTVYFLRVGEGMGNVVELVDGSVLTAISDVGSIAIICGESKFTDKLLSLDQIRRETPHRIVLPPLTVTKLAHIALLRMQRERLALQDSLLTAGSGASNGDSKADGWQVSVLESIVQRTYGPALIAERNAYLADTMIQVRPNRVL